MPVSFFFLCPVLLVLGYFLPVIFHLRFDYDGRRLELRLEMAFLFGLIRRTRLYGGPRRDGEKAGSTERVGKWFFGLRRRLPRYGLGGTLLASFIPPGYLPWLRVAERLEGQGRLTMFRWRTAVGTGEAAATAWLAGVLWGLKGGLVSFLHRRYRLPAAAARIAVEPSFAAARLATELECIFTFRIGQIMRASLEAFLLERLRRGVAVVHDGRTPDRGSHEDRHAEHKGDGRRQHHPRGSGGDSGR